MDNHNAVDNGDEGLSPPESSLPRTAPRKAFVQVSLRTLLLLTAAVGVWVAYFKNRHDTADLAQKITSMRPLARELFVDDPSRIAVVKQEERWYDQNDWKVYLPPGEYRLCLATQNIDEKELAPINQSVSIDPGTHDLALEQTRIQDKAWRIVVMVDGEEVLRVEEPAGWNAGHGSSGGGQFSNSTQLPAHEPVVLFRRRFMVPTSPSGYAAPMGPCNGLLLWIESHE